MNEDLKNITEYLDGNEEAFELIVNRYIKHIYNFVLKFLGTDNADEAKDIVQEVFLKAWKNLKKFDKKKSFKVWIFTIARNSVFDWLRKRKDTKFSSLDLKIQSGNSGDFGNSESSEGARSLVFEDNLADTGPLQDEIFAISEDVRKVQEAVDKLSVESKEIVILHNVEEMTFEEIAVITKKPMNTVKSQYRRALLDLKKYLSDNE